MLFNSLEFAIFLCIVLVGYYAFSHRAQNAWLLAASYTFYGWWDWRFLSLILLSTVADYAISLRMHRTGQPAHRKALLILSLALNLGLLSTFKYFNFFVDSFVALGASIGLNFDTPTLRLFPPVGISFYTFQTLSYTIDVYRRITAPERDFTTFALFVAYFPQLVAGPIERANELLPQLRSQRKVFADGIAAALVLILIGLFKKITIADAAGARADDIFADPISRTSWTLWKGALLFSLQIYGDFSGYSNIARGVSGLLGIRLVENFKTPYFADNVTDFWRRWHISLSEWLRDYLYVPLGGNRFGRSATYRNLMVTMLLGGIWHGAAWTFVAWGFLHGSFLIVHRLWRRLLTSWNPKPWVPPVFARAVSISLTFVAVATAFVLFRSNSITSGLLYIRGMFAFQGPLAVSDLATPVLLVALLLPIEILQYRSGGDLLAIRQLPVVVRTLLYTGLIVGVMLATNREVPFIYFQF